MTNLRIRESTVPLFSCFQVPGVQDPPVICGLNTGYHSKVLGIFFLQNFINVISLLLKIKKTLVIFFLPVYVEVGSEAGDTVGLDFVFGTTPVGGRTWDMKVTQVECSNINR